LQINPSGFRRYKIETSAKALETPFFFPAISSIRTNHSVYDYFNLLKKVAYPGFLISAYDIFHDEKREALIKELSDVTEGTTFTLLDSGNYESYWKEDDEWDIDKLESVLSEVTVDLCFSFDVFREDEKDVDNHSKDIIKYTAMTAGMQTSGTTIPIIHSIPKDFPKTVKKVVTGIYPEIIGIPERELGGGLFERAETIKRIRDELSKNEIDIPIHVLGTGNPISLLIYTLCGADLFDGLEWCKCTANPESGHLYHFVQKDLLDCNCKACKMDDVPYGLQTMAHNLIFYENFTEEIRGSLEENKISEIMSKYLPDKTVSIIEKISGLK
jgi:queuine/archaeosine tRNA-ribosyltransferase